MASPILPSLTALHAAVNQACIAAAAPHEAGDAGEVSALTRQARQHVQILNQQVQNELHEIGRAHV